MRMENFSYSTCTFPSLSQFWRHGQGPNADVLGRSLAPRPCPEPSPKAAIYKSALQVAQNLAASQQHSRWGRPHGCSQKRGHTLTPSLTHVGGEPSTKTLGDHLLLGAGFLRSKAAALLWSIESQPWTRELLKQNRNRTRKTNTTAPLST